MAGIGFLAGAARIDCPVCWGRAAPTSQESGVICGVVRDQYDLHGGCCMEIDWPARQRRKPCGVDCLFRIVALVLERGAGIVRRLCLCVCGSQLIEPETVWDLELQYEMRELVYG